MSVVRKERGAAMSVVLRMIHEANVMRHYGNQTNNPLLHEVADIKLDCLLIAAAIGVAGDRVKAEQRAREFEALRLRLVGP
jgi:hypothetical protein